MCDKKNDSYSTFCLVLIFFFLIFFVIYKNIDTEVYLL